VAIFYNYGELEIASHSFAMTLWGLCKHFKKGVACTNHVPDLDPVLFVRASYLKLRCVFRYDFLELLFYGCRIIGVCNS